MDAGQRAQRRQQRRQQEGHAPIAQQQVEAALQPHQHRRLVAIQLDAAMGEQPLAALHHLPGDQRETRLVRGPRIPQAEAGGEHQHGGDRQRPEFPARQIVPHGAG